tara:strand:- start:792 stop:1844 length:1053 start_codon:yes stop_codon:yes gene_type:complete
MYLLEVNSICAGYEKHNVVDSLSFKVKEGEIVSLLGASGCGKTTVLRTIAGFEPLRGGTIKIRNDNVASQKNTLPPEKRSIGMVFQDFALFPHLTITENIAFGLREINQEEKQERISYLLNAVNLPDLGKRYPHELSGGQQQRVALARALAPRPSLILMDEPFSNLDVDMREKLSLEIRDILSAQGITAVMVTHDQHEAFAMSDKIGVMSKGSIIQWDTPYNLYHQPHNRFVADFIGQGVFIEGNVNKPSFFDTEFGSMTSDRCDCSKAVGHTFDILLRPDDVVPDKEGEVKATIKEKAFKGAEILYTVVTDNQTKLLTLFPSHLNFEIGDKVNLSIKADHLICFKQMED